jgi:hypothetical protein
MILTIRNKSGASFCHQVAARVQVMLCDFYSMENHNIENNSTTTKAREKNRFGIIRILEFLYLWLN